MTRLICWLFGHRKVWDVWHCAEWVGFPGDVRLDFFCDRCDELCDEHVRIQIMAPRALDDTFALGARA